MQQADPDQLMAESVAQMELLLKMGIEPTNIDNHMVSLHHRIEILIELCERYNLPLRYPRRGLTSLTDPLEHEKIVQEADKRGIVLPDELVVLPFMPLGGESPAYEITKGAAIEAIRTLKAGVTELIFHPSLDSEELKGITTTWQMRRFEFDVFRDPEIQALLVSEGVQLTSWRELRELQRS